MTLWILQEVEAERIYWDQNPIQVVDILRTISGERGFAV